MFHFALLALESDIRLVLRLICRNPEGLFWAGDTAQTISAGSSFRFDDLKAFLYRIEVRGLFIVQCDLNSLDRC